MKLTKRIIPAVRIPVVGVVVILALLACQPSEQTEVQKADQQTYIEEADQQTNLEKADINQKPLQIAVIDLVANDAILKFTGTLGNHRKCKSTSNPYCVNVENDYRAEIIFRLIGSPDWEFSRMQLVAEPSDVESSDDESSAKLNFGKQSGFTPKMRTDFYVEVNGIKFKPDTNGIIELGGSPGVGQNFTLIDNNNLEQIYSYQLEVCDENDVCNQTDPKVENEG